MSFNLNLSSDEEEDEQGLEDLWKKAHEDQNKYEQDDEDDDNEDGTFSFDVSAPAVAKLPSGFNNDFEDDADSVDWEDAAEGGNDNDNDEKGEETSKLGIDIAIPKKRRPLQAVTVDLDSKPAAKTEGSKKRPKMARKKYRHNSLPRNVQFLLDNLHKTHLLALTAHALFNSSQCSDELLLPIAHSLLPSIWVSRTTDRTSSSSEDDGTGIPQGFCGPTVAQLREFCEWFFDLVDHAEQRRRQTLQANIAAGAPRPARRGNRRRKQPSASMTSSSETGAAFPPASLVDEAIGSSTGRLLEYCSYLAITQSENPQVLEQNLSSSTSREWTAGDKVNLLIALARSLGWRARYAVAVEPAKKDLDMDHPIFKNATVNVFQAISTWSRPSKRAKTSPGEVIDIEKEEEETKRKVRRKTKKEQASTTMDVQVNSDEFLASGADSVLEGWVEILCDVSDHRIRKSQALTSSHKPKTRWVHVDPQLKAIDDPGRVESYLFEIQQQRGQTQSQSSQRGLKKRNSGGLSRKRRPVAYVLAAEHYGDRDLLEYKRVTDVTPRYASSMVESMKLRGIAPKQQGAILTNMGATWWSRTVKTLNASFKGVSLSDSSSGKDCRVSGKSNEEAIDIVSDNEEPTKDNNDPAMHDVDQVQDAVENAERQELEKSVKSEALPTSKEKFKNHPLYVIPSVLKNTEVLAPDAKKRICGIFKGEIVYSRTDVSEALAEKKWLYQGRKVRESELKKPVKRVKARAKSPKGGGASFKALKSYGVGKENDGSLESEQKQLEMASEPLGDGMQDLYAIWQTKPWGPPYVGPADSIPVNEYKNVELELLNPGLTHIPEQGVAAVAKQLGIPYAPCLLGFEGHHGNRTPTIRGIVVHDHNADLLREASVEVVSRSVEEEHEKRRKAIYSKWKKLIVGVLTRDRLEREYGDQGNSNNGDD